MHIILSMGASKLIMKNKIALLILLILIGGLVLIFKSKSHSASQGITIPVKQERTWQVKSIDTMKYSRDLTGEKLNDPTFDKTIEIQVKNIAGLGATHVALGTPYDERFIPYLSRWVAAARRNNLKVWFRGNFSGWEGWFGYEKNLTREGHLELMREFVNKNGGLFENGDLFTPCPECENGGAGDPRRTGDVEGFRTFLIEEFQAANVEFRKIGKNVRTVGSANYDVASLIYNEQTANAVGDLIVIDHYVKSPQELAEDIRSLNQKSQAKILLGELGVPIPDIHGKLTEEEQAAWIKEALELISRQEEVIGINYWVSHGGSTAIFKNDNNPKPAAEVLKKNFSLADLN